MDMFKNFKPSLEDVPDEVGEVEEDTCEVKSKVEVDTQRLNRDLLFMTSTRMLITAA